MSLPINIADVLQGRSVESERLEFKEGWNPLRTLHALCAFANDFHNLGGGYIFVGVAEEKGRPVLPPAGLNPNDLDDLQKEVLRLGHLIQPAYCPIMSPYEIAGRHVLVLRAPGGQNRPYKAPESLAKDNHTYHYYIRKGSATVRAKHADEVELISIAAQVPFDDRMNQNASIDDLKLSLIQEHLSDIDSALLQDSKRIDFEQLCRQMAVIDGPEEFILPRNVGLMFFNERPEKFFPQTQIDVVQFPKGTGANTLIEKTFTGPISRQLRDALNYISSTVVEETVRKHPHRAEADRFFNYPYAAVEEILVNAVYHRSYELREPIEVRVQPDHITITSYPGPDRSISLEALKAGRLVARRYRNRRIGEFLKELRLTEGRGTGIPKVIQAMENNGSPPPLFETDEDRTFFTALLPINPVSAALKGGGAKGGLTPISTPILPPILREVLNEKAVALLAYCISPRDRVSIKAHLGLRDIKHLRERYLYPLLTRKLLRMTNPENPQSRSQKFKTTELGLRAIEAYEQYTLGKKEVNKLRLFDE